MLDIMRSSYANQSSIGGALAFRENNGSDNFIRFCSDAQAILNWLGTNKAKYEMLGTATKFDIAMPNTSAILCVVHLVVVTNKKCLLYMLMLKGNMLPTGLLEEVLVW